MAVKWNWKGDQVLEQVVREVLTPGLRDFGLDVEGESKDELWKGHGVITGTARRSIHTAEPGYNWASDNVVPTNGSPERGGSGAEPKRVQGKLSLQVGSGLEYAMPLHQGHHSFPGYHFLVNGLDKARPRLPQHIERHKLK